MATLSPKRINEVVKLSGILSSRKTKQNTYDSKNNNDIKHKKTKKTVSFTDTKKKKGKHHLYYLDTNKNTNTQSLYNDKAKLIKGKGKKQIKTIFKNKKGVITKSVVLNPLCDTCLTVEHNALGSMFSKNEENWKDFPFNIPILGSKIGDQTVDIDLGKKHRNKLIYYFAARPSLMHVGKQYPDVYNNSSNNGLMILDNNGKCKIHMNCPIQYKDDAPKGYNNNKQGYATHVHIIISDSKLNKWDDLMFTQSILCKIDKYQYNYHKVNGSRLIINAIDKKYNLPGTSGNLDYKKLKDQTPSQIRNSVTKILSNTTNIACKAKLKYSNPIDIPLLVYCYDPECNAAKTLVSSLYKAGFYNIMYYAGGFLDYHNRES
jgi:hypothetical protein